MSESGNKKPKYLAYFRVATKEQLNANAAKPIKEFEEFIRKREVPPRVRERIADAMRLHEAYKKKVIEKRGQKDGPIVFTNRNGEQIIFNEKSRD